MNAIGKKQILLVEDDEMLRESTAIFFEEEGYRVLAAKNGLEGMEKALEYQPDLILCDIAMPRMNGYDLYKIVNQNSSTCFIPFIFISAKTEKEDIRTGMQLGADDYITKPFDFDELLKTVELRIAKREKMAQHNERNFKTLLENTLVGIFIYHDGHIAFTNSKLQKIYGLSPDNAKSWDFMGSIHPEDREVVEEKIRRCVKGIQGNFSVNFRAYSAKQKILHLESWGAPAVINSQNLLVGNIINVNECLDSMDGKLNGNNRVPRESSEQISSVTPSNPHNLSNREIEVLTLVCQGFTNQEIAGKLFLSVRTIDSHRSNILEKTETVNTAGLVVYAIKNGFFKI